MGEKITALLDKMSSMNDYMGSAYGYGLVNGFKKQSPGLDQRNLSTYPNNPSSKQQPLGSLGSGFIEVRSSFVVVLPVVESQASRAYS